VLRENLSILKFPTECKHN